MNNIKLQHLKFFAVAYEERSISGAARKVNATQSGVSVQLRDLEDQLGLTLFDRLSTGIQPTKAGDAVYRRTLKVLRELGQLREDITSHSGGLSGQVRLGIMPTFARAVLAPVLADFSSRYPLVDVKVTEGYSALLTQLVPSGELDIAVVPDGDIPRGLRTTYLDTDLELLTSRSPIQNTNGTVILDDVAPLHFVLPGPGNGRRSKIDRHLQNFSNAKHSILEMDSMMTTLDIVRRGDFCSILPGCLCLPDLNDPEINLYLIGKPRMTVDYMLIEPARAAAPPAVKLFADSLAEEIRRACALCRTHFGVTL